MHLLHRRTGCLIGHIRAKGLVTNLMLTVKVTEDSRFCFAGVHKGSMEMIALDLGKLPSWSEQSSAATTKRKISYKDLITNHSHSDPKLRGFGAVIRVQGARNTVFGACESAKYVLACGRGIKNVHLWTFSPDSAGGPEWSFVYDVASNGNTIEQVNFRDGGRQTHSKSAGMCARVWDMSASANQSPAAVTPVGASSLVAHDSVVAATNNASEDEEDDKNSESSTLVSSKLAYEDIPNSHDVRVFSGQMGFGGTYEFAMVNLDAPRWANR